METRLMMYCIALQKKNQLIKICRFYTSAKHIIPSIASVSYEFHVTNCLADTVYIYNHSKYGLHCFRAHMIHSLLEFKDM